MTKTYRAARLILDGATERPNDIDKKTWRELTQRAAKGELFLTTHAGLVASTKTEAAIYDAFALGATPGDIVFPDSDRAVVNKLWRAWKRHAAVIQAEADPTDTGAADAQPSAIRFLRRVLETLERGGDHAAVEDMLHGEDFEALSAAISGGLQYISAGVSVPNGYFSFRWDDDQQKPLEVSFGMTLRQRPAKAQER